MRDVVKQKTHMLTCMHAHMETENLTRDTITLLWPKLWGCVYLQPNVIILLCICQVYTDLSTQHGNYRGNLKH